ncbi:MAG: L-seryl-tRNA(Sec) selenium transferase [Acidobacteriia bacterium]|nr:L-seryl-tRNA(Sec) selenium transferase [Terriglobia bacterium]
MAKDPKLATRNAQLFRKLPSVDELLHQSEMAQIVEREGRAATLDATRAVLERLRAAISAGPIDDQQLELAIGGFAEAVERELRRSLQMSLRQVINSTGVVLHTNLGRAPLSGAALDHARRVATTYSNLEFNLDSGERGKRDVHVERLFARLLSEYEDDISTVVVNNNAAAVLLALNTLAEGGEVVVSRGELVEIGGSFRIPDVMSKSGATLREVGTTNRTRLADYERALNERTRLILRVHRSNFQIVGFTEQPSLGELVEVAHKRGLPILEDLGSGALFEMRTLGIGGEPGVGDSLRAGVDVVTYSGDKLLGGPQAGMLSGRREIIARIRSNPLFRALRVDKLIYAALEATLLAYVRQDHDAVPALRMMRLSAEEIGKRAQALAHKLRPPVSGEVIEGESLIGGGAAPGAGLPTRLLALTCEGLGADEFASRLRKNDPPIVARVEEGRVLLDLRTVFPEQDEQIGNALQAIGQ